MKIIFKRNGIEACRAMMLYIVIVLGKYLQMMAAYSIFKKQVPRVVDVYETFNKNFIEFNSLFEEVTNEGLNLEYITVRDD